MPLLSPTSFAKLQAEALRLDERVRLALALALVFDRARMREGRDWPRVEREIGIEDVGSVGLGG